MISKLEKVFIEVELKNCDDIFKISHKFLSQYLFRGQANSEWNISHSLERFFFTTHGVGAHHVNIDEANILKEFMWKYPLYATSKLPCKEEPIEWLSIMQHYGAPTRLLDVTTSFFVAIFFATAGNFAKESSVWAFNRHHLNNTIFERYRADKGIESGPITEDIYNAYCLQIANEAVNNNCRNTPNNQLLIVKPLLCNERMSKQQGLFLAPTRIDCAFSEILSNYYKIKKDDLSFGDFLNEISGNEDPNRNGNFLIKINIPKSLNFHIINRLRSMNITYESLFPGLEGFCKSMSYPRFSLDEYK